MTRRQPSLLHRCGCERWKPYAIARGVYVRHVCLVVLVDLQASARISLEAGGRDVEQVGVDLSSDRVQQAFGVHALAALHFRVHQPVAVYRDFGYFLTESKNNALASQIKAERFDYFLIVKVKKSGPLFDHFYLDAERRKHRSVFESDHARAHDDQIARNPASLSQLIGVKNSRAFKGNVRRVRGPRSASDQHVIGGYRCHVTIVVDLDTVLIHKSRGAVQCRYAV